MAPKLQSWTTICCRRQERPWNRCDSQAWFMIGCSLKPSPFRAWVLFDFSGLCLLREWKKERKNTEKEMGFERKWRKERKKRCSEIEREETFTIEDQVLPWLKQDFLKQETISLTQQFLKSNVVLMWIRCIKRVTQQFFFFVKAYKVQWITFFLTPWLLFFFLLNWLLAACYK